MRKLLMWISVLAVVALTVLNLTFDFSLKPDEVYPMTNQKIIWEK